MSVYMSAQHAQDHRLDCTIPCHMLAEGPVEAHSWGCPPCWGQITKMPDLRKIGEYEDEERRDISEEKEIRGKASLLSLKRSSAFLFISLSPETNVWI